MPALVGTAESALVDAGIVRGRVRVEGIEATARQLDIAVPWSIEESNGQRFVANPAAMRRLGDFLTVARKRVSHYGITRREYVSGGITTEVRVETVDLFCSLVKGLVWLDDAHDWFWLPTGKNSVLNRLAKILRVAPRLTLAEARAGVLRDRRMEDVELPPDVFRNLCASLPWCRIEGDELLGSSDIPVEEEDSQEMLLLQLFRQYGPVLRRRDLWTIANEAGIEKVHFDRLLSDSNIVVKYGPEYYALIGSDTAISPDQSPDSPKEAAPRYSEQPEIDLPAEAMPGTGVLDRCDPESADFQEQVLSCIFVSSARLRVSGIWSLNQWAPGFRFKGVAIKNLDYSFEWVGERGTDGPNGIDAWGTTDGVAYRIDRAWWKPRLFYQYDYATGDKNPTDGEHGTFDTMYPTAHDRFGITDQFGWQNIVADRAGITVEPHRRWTVTAQWLDFWLATPEMPFTIHPAAASFAIRPGDPVRISARKGIFTLGWN